VGKHAPARSQEEVHARAGGDARRGGELHGAHARTHGAAARSEWHYAPHAGQVNEGRAGLAGAAPSVGGLGGPFEAPHLN